MIDVFSQNKLYFSFFVVPSDSACPSIPRSYVRKYQQMANLTAFYLRIWIFCSTFAADFAKYVKIAVAKVLLFFDIRKKNILFFCFKYKFYTKYGI